MAAPPRDLHGLSRCHLPLISGGKPDDGGVWDSHITNPDDDKTYTIRLRVGSRTGGCGCAAISASRCWRDRVLDTLQQTFDGRLPHP